MPKPTKSIPIDVAARVVGAATNVPMLGDAPFAASGKLEPGIHVHWALPDALAKADAHESRPPRFRGVPDLWLVVRFNPVKGDAPRTHREWIVDSIAETVTPLAQWQPPADRALDRVHTAPGVLPRVAPGWGEWALEERTVRSAHHGVLPGLPHPPRLPRQPRRSRAVALGHRELRGRRVVLLDLVRPVLPGTAAAAGQARAPGRTEELHRAHDAGRDSGGRGAAVEPAADRHGRAAAAGHGDGHAARKREAHGRADADEHRRDGGARRSLRPRRRVGRIPSRRRGHARGTQGPHGVARLDHRCPGPADDPHRVRFARDRGGGAVSQSAAGDGRGRRAHGCRHRDRLPRHDARQARAAVRHRGRGDRPAGRAACAHLPGRAGPVELVRTPRRLSRSSTCRTSVSRSPTSVGRRPRP